MGIHWQIELKRVELFQEEDESALWFVRPNLWRALRKFIVI